ncbi:hypothetical protein FISHEDRAFT_57574 [Fistulina hepatica ATCC 64428]|uniref:Uncharacterized protein n=1 Tax=Fistulina hepatica ATCC 64428 TaxID=1128425 RepID=A0A0D7AHD3_9AGAR|nr:hypothetical protein FISHEDRAFT_57574 [Fistulina hepatica ATCC 64428]
MGNFSTTKIESNTGHKPLSASSLPDRAAALQYARLKVDHGWQNQTINEVEKLYSLYASRAPSKATKRTVGSAAVKPPEEASTASQAAAASPKQMVENSPQVQAINADEIAQTANIVESEPSHPEMASSSDLTSASEQQQISHTLPMDTNSSGNSNAVPASLCGTAVSPRPGTEETKKRTPTNVSASESPGDQPVLAAPPLAQPPADSHSNPVDQSSVSLPAFVNSSSMTTPSPPVAISPQPIITPSESSTARFEKSSAPSPEQISGASSGSSSTASRSPSQPSDSWSQSATSTDFNAASSSVEAVAPHSWSGLLGLSGQQQQQGVDQLSQTQPSFPPPANSFNFPIASPAGSGFGTYPGTQASYDSGSAYGDGQTHAYAHLQQMYTNSPQAYANTQQPTYAGPLQGFASAFLIGSQYADSPADFSQRYAGPYPGFQQQQQQPLYSGQRPAFGETSSTNNVFNSAATTNQLPPLTYDSFWSSHQARKSSVVAASAGALGSATSSTS